MRSDLTNYSYIIITPARNEEAAIEETLKSVVSQTCLPKKWVIVDDGSTDRTEQIVNGYVEKYDFIQLLRNHDNGKRNFGSKVNAFNAGYELAKKSDHEFVVSLDADISFGEDYFEFILNRFDEIPGLGVAGTPFQEGSFSYDYNFTNIEHVSGACQVFKRECFEDIGGYQPVDEGGIDWIAVTTSRMRGWKTRTFTERTCRHHRKIGSANGGPLTTRFRHGMKDYCLGGHPLWEVFRGVYQMKSKPYLIGGMVLFSGYAWASLKRIDRPISQELMSFNRKEQLRRLREFIFK